jgi:hypothetical protein
MRWLRKKLFRVSRVKGLNGAPSGLSTWAGEFLCGHQYSQLVRSAVDAGYLKFEATSELW